MLAPARDGSRLQNSQAQERKSDEAQEKLPGVGARRIDSGRLGFYSKRRIQRPSLSPRLIL